MAKVQFVEIDDIRMPVTSFGNGSRNLVILPGIYVTNLYKSADAVENAFAEMFSDYTVYLMDRDLNMHQGHTTRDMADDTSIVMDKLGIKDAYVFGASMGGMIALFLAADHPDKVQRMVVASSVPKTSAKIDHLFDIWAQFAKDRDREGLALSFADYLSSEASREIFRKIALEATSQCTDEDLNRFIYQCTACQFMDLRDEVLAKITCPTFAIGCLGDNVFGPDGTIEIANSIGCDYYMYDGNFGHAVYDEAPDFRQRLLDFFNE